MGQVSRRAIWLGAAFTAAMTMAPVQAETAPKPDAERPAWAAPPPAPPLAEGAREVSTTMRDGVVLRGNLYLPEGDGPFPCIVTRTPYHKDGPMYEKLEGKKAYTGAGYAYLVQDVRGQGRSEGVYDAFEPDILDGYDTVEWMARQPWCNGSVGITGGSAMGITGTMAAIAAPPHLKAAFVAIAPSNLVDSSYIGGVFKDKDEGDWARGRGTSEEEIARIAAGYVDDASWNRLAMGELRKFIRIPVFNYGGWYDIFNEGNVRNFTYLQNHGSNGARGKQKLEMGPFGHGQSSGDIEYPDNGRAEARAQELRWFDYWLKGIDNGIMEEPPVRAYLMAGARKGDPSPKNRWLKLGNWPPAYRETSYYLQGDGSLSTRKPAADAKARSYLFDPAKPVQTVGGANLTFELGPMDQRAIGKRQDYLRFETAPLDRDVVIAGPVGMDLWAATDGPDTDFMVKLVDVYPDGYEAILLDSAIRTKFRKGRMPDDIQMMTPGAPEKFVLDLWDTAITFEKGHRIAVHVTSSNAPKFNVNPNTGENPGPGAAKRVARNTIFLDALRASAIRLPVIYPDK